MTATAVSAPIAENEIPIDDLNALTPAHGAFAEFVASGMSYQQAAENAGFAKPSGSRLAKYPSIRKRIERAIADPDRAMLAAGYTLAMIQTREVVGNEEPGTEAWRANMALHLTALDKLARFKGWLVERKQVSQVTARVNVARGDLEAAIRADVERLAPGALRRIESGEADLKSIAAGTQAVVVDASGKPEDKAKA